MSSTNLLKLIVIFFSIASLMLQVFASLVFNSNEYIENLTFNSIKVSVIFGIIYGIFAAPIFEELIFRYWITKNNNLKLQNTTFIFFLISPLYLIFGKLLENYSQSMFYSQNTISPEAINIKLTIVKFIISILIPILLFRIINKYVTTQNFSNFIAERFISKKKYYNYLLIILSTIIFVIPHIKLNQDRWDFTLYQIVFLIFGTFLFNFIRTLFGFKFGVLYHTLLNSSILLPGYIKYQENDLLAITHISLICVIIVVLLAFFTDKFNNLLKIIPEKILGIKF
jgi:hypothetical protein